VQRSSAPGPPGFGEAEGGHSLGELLLHPRLAGAFGGVGDSGIGREGGNFSREFFTEPKAVIMQIRSE
jgi:hypothetical protein